MALLPFRFDDLATFLRGQLPILGRIAPPPAQSPAEAAIWDGAPAFPGERRIVIHAGPAKTGTTAIQGSFRKSRAALRRRGILYPSVADNHGRPLRAVFSPGFAAEIAPEGKAEDHVRQIRAALEAELRATDWRICVISGEGLSQLTGAEWIALRDWIQPFADRIGVIFTIRDPLDLARSMIQQVLKRGYPLEAIYSNPPSPAARPRLEPILSAFPPEAIRLFDFAAATRSPRGLVFDFARSIGLDRQAIWLLSKQRTYTNSGLSQTAVDQLDRRNRLAPQRKPVTWDELEALRKISGPKFRLPDALVETILTQAEADRAWLKAKFGFVQGKGPAR